MGFSDPTTYEPLTGRHLRPKKGSPVTQHRSTSSKVSAALDGGIAQIQATRLITMENKLAEIINLLPAGPARTAAIEASAKIPPAKIETSPEVQSMRLLMLNDNLHAAQDALPEGEIRRSIASVIVELHAFGQCFDRQLRLG